MKEVTVIGTGLQRYIIELHNLGDDMIAVIKNLEKNKTVVKLFLRKEERRVLIEALRGDEGA
ncbi:MAG: hypothetical protein DRN03_05345 [Thermoplasmata archaeon]|nr:MAG: hypothetical protein DRN03_05345 [Thermoplasmata archaeon]